MGRDVTVSVIMDGERTFVLGATVATGFERTALDECLEKLGKDSNAYVGRGRVFFHIRRRHLSKALQLRTVDNLFVVVKQLKELDLQKDADEALEDLCRPLTHADWVQALEAWADVRQVDFVPTLLDQPRPAPPTAPATPTAAPSALATPSGTASSADETPLEDGRQADPSEKRPPLAGAGGDVAPPPYLPPFRVTGHRVGARHQFSSREVAGKLGDLLVRRYGWPVRLKDFDLQVLGNVCENSAVVAISLTAESMHRRNIVHFGPTTLRSTLAHCMLRLAEPQLGDVICDPMCGGGSIPIECALNWPCYTLGADNHDVACQHTGGNVAAVNEKRTSRGGQKMRMDVLQWDVTHLPLCSNCIDIIVSDMPFGKRIGSRLNNWELYRRSLLEMGRVCRQGTGKAVLLTQDKKCMAKILMKVSFLWKKQLQLTINIGGLFACVYVLKRCSKPKRGTTERGGKAQRTAEQGTAQQGATEQGATEQGATEQGAAEQGAAEQGATERGATEQGTVEQGATEQGTAEQGATEQGTTEQGATEQGATEQGATEQGATEQGTVEQGATEKGSAQQGATEQGTAEQGATEQGTVEQGATEIGSAEQGATEQGTVEQGATEIGSAEEGATEHGSDGTTEQGTA